MGDIRKYPYCLKNDKSKGTINGVDLVWYDRGKDRLIESSSIYKVSKDFLKAVAEHLTVQTANQRQWTQVQIIGAKSHDTAADNNLPDPIHIPVKVLKPDNTARTYHLEIKGLDSTSRDLDNISVTRVT